MTHCIARSYHWLARQLRQGREVALTGACLLLLVLCAQGCFRRTFYEPRSEVLKAAESKGMQARSIVEDRELFFSQEASQKKRLLALVRTRSEGDFRDVNYKLGPGDEIEVNVFDVPEMNVTASIRQSGFVSLPLIGAVQAKELTEGELVEAISDRLKTYVRNPQVSVFIEKYGSQKVAVMGAVRRPGAIALKKGSNSILELIAQAGGVSEEAGNFINFIPSELSGVKIEGASASDAESRAQLALASGGELDVRASGIEIYLDQVLGTTGGIPLEIPVRGGDMVIIPEAGKINIEGEVVKPGTYDVRQQLTLLGALAASGGITYSAKVDEIEVIREVEGNQKAHLVLDLGRVGAGEERDVRLRNGDIVRVPSDTARRLSQDTFESISQIINFGVGGSVSLGP